MYKPFPNKNQKASPFVNDLEKHFSIMVRNRLRAVEKSNQENWNPFWLEPKWKVLLVIARDTPRKFNSSPLKIGKPKRKLVFQSSIFRGYVRFWGCIDIIVPGPSFEEV